MDTKRELKLILERHEGRDRAITSRELSQLVGIPDREIRLTIEELINDGLPVVSATEYPAGYFLPMTIEEAREYTQSLRSRSIQIFLRRRKVIKNTEEYLRPAVQGKLL